MGVAEETTAVGAVEAEQSVHDVILEMLEHDPDLDTGVKDAVLDALAEVVGQSQDEAETHTAPTFLTSISVVGFRGIGPQARLDLYPSPGLMVVSGRNGSGKSSFAEALELALTGTSYRWLKKEALWTESWRNLHRADPCAIRVGFTAEGSDPFTVGVDWATGAELTERTTWTQTGAQQRVEGTDDLGWARPLELWRPILSYDELGRLFDGGPSALYDALAKLLGLEVLADAEKWLAAQLKSTKSARERADDERKRLLAVLSESADERAERATALLRKRGGPALDEVLALATGSADPGLQVAPALRALTQLETPTLDEIETAASRLRTAGQAVAASTGDLADSTRQRVDLLQAALRFHDHAGDTDCPVCGQGSLDNEWAARTRDAVASAEEALGEYRAATTELTQARSAATGLVDHLATVDEVAGVLPALATYNQAVAAAQQTPEGATALAAHLELALVAAVAAADTLRAQADEALTLRESTWAPLRRPARRVGAHGRRSSRPRRHREDHDGGQEVDVRSCRAVPQPAAGTDRRAGPQDLGVNCVRRATSTWVKSPWKGRRPVGARRSAGRWTASPPKRCR